MKKIYRVLQNCATQRALVIRIKTARMEDVLYGAVLASYKSTYICSGDSRAKRKLVAGSIASSFPISKSRAQIAAKGYIICTAITTAPHIGARRCCDGSSSVGQCVRWKIQALFASVFLIDGDNFIARKCAR